MLETMSKIVLLCERLSGTMTEDLIEAGFVFKRYLDSVICCMCGFETRGTLSVEHIQFMHKLFNPKCEMVCYTTCSYENYATKKNCVLETERVMKSTFRSWPKCLPEVERLVSAGFFYTGVGDELSCIECKCVLHDWKKTDDPWIEHKKASPDCLLVKLHDTNL